MKKRIESIRLNINYKKRKRIFFKINPYPSRSNPYLKYSLLINH